MNTTRWLIILLAPIARLCVRRGIQIQALLEALKESLLHAAEEELQRNGEKQSISRLSAITGMQRKDIVARLERDSNRQDESPAGLCARVIHTWLNATRKARSNKGRTLPIDGSKSFYALVRSLSTDVHPAAVLKDLKRLHMVTEIDDTHVQLEVDAFISRRDIREGEHLLALDVADLCSAVEDNLTYPDQPPHLHARTEFDNVDPAQLPKLKAWMIEQGKLLHQRARTKFSSADRDCNSALNFKGRARVTITTFGYCETIEDPTSKELL